ncbi:efflux RND transporter periplasmic adaptor subunit [Campylobacter hepaticus]|uniref:Efflux RND transporter periplasmic adaptor subunit n=1 Tax=Campylobacter hepaticus TaxID=1813019 RepID=A0A424Z1X3_9BACT|nr:efflux RND transporter periplasmic adaptor subunit [Campylobacter hepaticus]AXP08471.1 efflux RND transporter periplasmic adaptor subunit [Campylobacter hepaticus]MCZ0772307.1 efflux RND transporter periplasmic adaptor subunit [Campylobacter hepaticus]MCZ0773775.1 efflux RND transporter periplasmic adaptor subunit [Campylobacter hepaticus]MCZ0775026.1 efflux RND transporter periplasmic adaptor subunit [Campylobacter hepaticus]MDX2322895.1 efflux RND transporter periplasmic adaptor subunit [
MKIILFLLFTFNLAFSETIYASFNVEALKHSKLSLESIGLVDKIFVNIGQKVKKGELLLILNQENEKIALENAQNAYKIALEKYKNIQSKMQKIQAVKNVIDKQSYENMQTEFNTANLNLIAAKINIAHYKNILEKKELRAPYDAIVANKFIQVGEGVSGVAQPLIEIFSYPQNKLVLSFDEKYKNKVKIADEFLYKIDQNQTQYKGKISLIYPSIEIKTRKIYAEVETQNLTPGLFGEGSIITKD